MRFLVWAHLSEEIRFGDCSEMSEPWFQVYRLVFKITLMVDN